MAVVVLRSDGLLGELKKGLAERVLNAEMDAGRGDAPEQALREFEQSHWGEQFPTVAKSWHRRWKQVTRLFTTSPD